jgi:hypothetical protein
MSVRQCPDCGVYTSNDDHTCIEYTDAHPCETCGADTVFVMIAAPGTGQGYSCRNGHYHGTNRELTREDVI